MHVRIAVVQFAICHLDTAKNLARAERFIQRARRKGAHVIVFPEDCVTGSLFGDLTKLDATHATRDALCALAKKYAIDIVTGSCMEKTPQGNFNTSYYIDACGNVLGTYHKNHLYPSEYTFLSPGTEAVVFDTAHGRAGIVICWDMLFPEIFVRLKQQGVEIIYCPSYWYREIAEHLAVHNPRSEEQHLDALCAVRALETHSAVVYCNAASNMRFPNNTRDTLIGHSQITLPVLGAVKKLSHNREGMFVHTIDTSILQETAKIYRA